jgi:hypothetical protein
MGDYIISIYFIQQKIIVKESYKYETWKVGKEEDLRFGVENSFTRIYKWKSSFKNKVEMKNV